MKGEKGEEDGAKGGRVEISRGSGSGLTGTVSLTMTLEV